MTKLFITTALMTALAVPAFAAKPADGKKLAENQTYTWWLGDSIPSMDPAKNTTTNGSEAILQLFEGLMNMDEKGAPIPGAAESYEVSDDKLTYTFHIREDAKWSNGDPVTAGDFVYSWRRTANPETAAKYAWYLELMNVVNAPAVVAGEKAPDTLGVKAINDKTLEVKLSTPTPFFIKTLSHPAAFPVLQKTVEEHGDTWTRPGNMVSNGAYILESHKPGVEHVMKRNPHYWDAENVLLETVRGVVVNDKNVALTRFLAGELDRVDIPGGQFPRLKEKYPDTAVTAPKACSYAYVYNLSDKGPEALKDKRIREAISLGINRKVIVDNVLQGGQRPATTWTHWAIEGFVAPETELAKLDQAEKTARAKELLAEAGYGPDNPLKLSLQYNTSDDHKKLAVAVQQFLKPLGVQITLSNYEWKVHLERFKNQDYDMARYAWCGDYNEASTFLDWFRTGGYNAGKWSNAEFDKALADSKTADDPTTFYTKAEEILAEEVPAAFVYHYTLNIMLNPKIKGVSLENVQTRWYAKDMYRLAD